MTAELLNVVPCSNEASEVQDIHVARLIDLSLQYLSSEYTVRGSIEAIITLLFDLLGRMGTSPGTNVRIILPKVLMITNHEVGTHFPANNFKIWGGADFKASL